MRPVERGGAPSGASTYEQMCPFLFERLGRYCSYCEYPVVHSPHAEHIVPKGRYRAYRDRWDNLLVSCTYCNGRKGRTLPAPDKLDDYLWPTQDNTALAFSYAHVVPVVAALLKSPLREKAARLRGLVQLAVTDDERAKARAETWVMAEQYRDRMKVAPDPELVREMVADLAKERGFFSVWMEVFASDRAMRRRLIDAFLGTAQSCFDPATTAPIARPGGRL